MQVAGVICEYNPFHTGHQWQLSELRRRGAAAIVCAMSGNYTQRGDFAIVRKHARAEAAIRGGADLVLELPLPWATASAEAFAQGGVSVLAATGVVDTLAFGSECADADTLLRLAEVLTSDAYASALKSELVKRDSFAAARQRAAARFAPAAALSDPNDILGVEYCKAIRGTLLAPLPLPRVGAAHDGAPSGAYASASYLRAHMDAPFLTPDMRRLYDAECAAGRAPVSVAAAERAILARLRGMDDFSAYDEGGEGLYRRFAAAARRATSVAELLEAVKTKRYAHARLRRMLLAVYLGLPPAERPARVPYIRVLAMNDKGKSLLHDMRKKSTLPVLVKSADVRELSADARRLMDREAKATDLYALAYPDLTQSAGGSEWRTNPVIV
ncbi:MAG: nucleotidyltransferase family protein [Oscillospiraceae bacterium]|nr:nucleotidyltransferase family protein [Oscillospiraceae bacterium]